MKLLANITANVDGTYYVRTGLKYKFPFDYDQELDAKKIYDRPCQAMQMVWLMDISKLLQKTVEEYVASDRYRQVKESIMSLYSDSDISNE